MTDHSGKPASKAGAKAPTPDRAAGRGKAPSRQDRDGRPGGQKSDGRSSHEGPPSRRDGQRPFARHSRGRDGERDTRPPRRDERASQGKETAPGHGGEAFGHAGEAPGRPRGATGALIELDRELMKLLVRRATLVSRIRGGREHAASPAAIQAEKAVRTAWEEGALSFSKDPRFTRRLFDLLQDMKVLSKEQADSKGAFNLAPPQKPVAARVTGPTCDRAARMWALLAARLGAPLRLEPLYLSDAFTVFAKTLAQAGATLSCRETGKGVGAAEASASSPLALAGQTVFAGDDLFSLCLLAFAAAGGTGVTRLTGGRDLKSADLSPLRQILPLLGARLAHVVPRSQGLPANLECSGAIPQAIAVPPDLPREAATALLLAPLLWNRSVAVDLAALPAETAMAALAEAGPLHRECGAAVETRGSTLFFSPQAPILPPAPYLPLDPALSAYLLALPAFAGGEISLTGQWPAHRPKAHAVTALLASAGIALETGEDSVTARVKPGVPLHVRDTRHSPDLLPLALALSALERRAKTGRPAPPPEMEEEDAVLAGDFFAFLGLALEDGSPVPAAPSAWSCPDGWWGMALALCACGKPGLLLANPSEVTRLMPAFWTLYNALPAPTDPASPAARRTEEPVHDKTPRRRIIAD